jgi:serine/threonine-protein phosphatase 2A activator
MAFPILEVLDLAKDRPDFITPVKRINDEPDVAHFLRTKAYRDIGIFLMQLNRSVVPRKSDTGAKTFPLPQGASSSPLAPLSAPPERAPLVTSPPPPPSFVPESIQRLQRLLERIGSYTDEAPPDPGPRRFGNISFRTWHTLLAERAFGLLGEFIIPWLSSESVAATPEITSYFLGAFGSAQRLDYGTGHELSFLAFLGCLWKLNFFAPAADDDATRMSRHLVLDVIEPYLVVIRKLIQTYTLEPAGSHGVWGLDDHAFLPYVFGSAQLTRAIAPDEPTPLEGSIRGAPRTGDVAKPDAVQRWRASNMYFSAVGFIYDVKTGPFWEHSPMLYDISGVKDGWGKINKGMIKMFNAEVLSKFPVVQHFPFGALFSWDLDPEAPPATSVSTAVSISALGATAPTARAGPPGQQPAASSRVPPAPPPQGVETTPGQVSMTKAPWAR